MLPLMSVFMGAVFLHEQLKPAQILAIFCAGIGVIILTVNYGAIPWLSLTLALSFSAYSFIRKTIAIESLPGLAVETAVCAIPSLIYIYWLEYTHQATFMHSNMQTDILLVGSGILTTLPLLWFTKAARLMSLSALGFIQYFAPTVQFLLGVLVFHEPFNKTRLIAFGFIWLGLIIFSIGTLRSFRAMQPAPETN
jgi:chloramphenicol-sensitive protein RarD